MKKLFFFFAAMLVALTVNATSTTLGSDNPKDTHANAISAVVSSYDTIFLKAGIYTESERISVSNATKVIKAISDTVIIKANKDHQVRNGAKVTYDGIFFDGSTNGSYRGFTTYDASAGKELRFNNCEFYNFPKYVITTNSESTSIDSVIVNNCYFHNNTRGNIYFPTSTVDNQETIYGLIVKNSTFANNDASSEWSSIVDVETKASPAENIKVLVDHCTFYNNLTKEAGHASVRTHTVLNAEVSNCIFAHPTSYERRATYMDANPSYAKHCIAYNFTVDTDDKCHTWMTQKTNCSITDPMFVDAANGDLTLELESPAINAGTDGKTLGDPRWWPVISYPQTDFSGDGYVCSASNATAIDPSIEINNHYGEANPYLRYTGSTNTYAEVAWKIEATRACFVNVKVNLADNSWNNATDGNFQNGKHIFGVEILDEDGQRIDTVAEGVYGNGKLDGYGTYPQVDLGLLAVPEAGVYTIKLLNPRGWSKCGVNNVTLKYESDLPTATVTAKGDWDSWAADLEFTKAKNCKTASVKKTFNKGEEIGFKMLINGEWRANGWWFKRDATTTDSGITANGDNMKIIADYTGEYTLTWTYATNILSVTFPEPTLNNGWYLVGTFNGEEEWGVENLTPAKKFAVNPDNEDEFVITADLKTGDRFKAVYVYLDVIQADSWKPAEGTGYVVTDWTAGEKDIYFRVNYYNTWDGHFYIAPNAPVVTYHDFEIDLRGGQLGTDKANPNNRYLTIDGETYNYAAEMPYRYNAYLTNAKYNGNQHGYVDLVATIPVVAGNYKITVGNCEYNSKNGAVKNAAGTETLNIIDANGQTITAIETPKNCYHNGTSTNITSVWFVAAEAQTIQIVCPQYAPYIKVEQVESVPEAVTVYNVTFAKEAGIDGSVPAAQEVVAGEKLTLPVNQTLYKEGYTLTGWSDGVNTYLPGAQFTPTEDVTLTAVFAENAANLLTATSIVTVKWFFGTSNNAPALNLQGAQGGTGFIVAQATIGENKVDVKLAIDATSGKCSNAGRADEWAQVNSGTTFSFPSKKGITVAVRAYNDPTGSTLDGNDTYTWAGNVATFSSESTAGTSILVDGANTYFSYLEVSYPASSATAIDNANANAKAVKSIVNGQLLITRDGKTYNVLGTIVK